MIICFIAWGSLLWNNNTLELENEWKKSNVKLPLNFSRISDGGNGRLTLVIDRDGILNNVYYGKTKINHLNAAINILKNREKTSSENIGYINTLNNTKRTATLDEKYIQLLINFAKKNKIDAFVWSDLQSNFKKITGNEFTTKNAIEYINSKRNNKNKYNTILEYIFLSKIYGNIHTPFSNKITKYFIMKNQQ
jgi:hypothetical protein